MSSSLVVNVIAVVVVVDDVVIVMVVCDMLDGVSPLAGRQRRVRARCVTCSAKPPHSPQRLLPPAPPRHPLLLLGGPTTPCLSAVCTYVSPHVSGPRLARCDMPASRASQALSMVYVYGTRVGRTYIYRRSDGRAWRPRLASEWCAAL